MFALVILCAIAATAAGSQQRRTEETDSTEHILALDPRWIVVFETAPSAPAAFDEQTAYVPLKGGELVAVGLDRGDVRWKIEMATTLSPATGDGLVFTSEGGDVVALVDRTGAVAWRTKVGSALAQPPHFDAGMVIVTTSAGELLAMRGQDGEVQWRQPLGASLAVAPAAAGDRLFAGLTDRRLLALARDSGHQEWAFTVADPITGILALDDQLIVGTRGNWVYSFRLDQPRLRWQRRVGGDIAGAAVADDDLIYFAALDNLLRAVNRSNGNLRWMQPIPSRPAGGPLRTGDVVIMPTVSADIGAYVARTGKPAFTIKAAGEVGGLPFLREAARPTAPRFVAVSRDGKLQGFAARYEQPAVPLPDPLPGAKVGS